MSSVECLRDFVNERLTAAVEEIFGVFKRTIIQYEEEIYRQRRLLDIVWKPHIQLQRIELPQQQVSKEEVVFADQQLCNQERNSSMDQEDPEPPRIKEEPEELPTSQEEEHLRTVHAFITKPFACGICGESFSQRCSLKKHNTIHTGEKPHTCKTCGKSFRLGAYLAQHVRTHTGEKPFTCETCSRSFSIKSNLKAHYRIHTGERRHSCSACGKRFYKRSDLKRHFKIHAKPDRSFRFTADLRVHMRRLHTSEIPHL